LNFLSGKVLTDQDHYEGRRWLGWQRHLVISAVSFLFLARVYQALREKKSRPDPAPSPYRRFGGGADVVVERLPSHSGVRENSAQASMAAKAQCPGTKKPYQNYPTKITPTRYSINPNQTMPMALT
jgi:hypothetical protein